MLQALTQVITGLLTWTSLELSQVPGIEERRENGPLLPLNDHLEDFIRECKKVCFLDEKTSWLKAAVDAMGKLSLEVYRALWENLTEEGKGVKKRSRGFREMKIGFDAAVEQLWFGMKSVPEFESMENYVGLSVYHGRNEFEGLRMRGR